MGRAAVSARPRTTRADSRVGRLRTGRRTPRNTTGASKREKPRLSAVGKDVETDLPRDQLPNLAAIASEIGPKAIYQLVVKFPMVHPGTVSPYGSVQIPDLAKIKAAADQLFTAPGVKPSIGAPATPDPSPAGSGAP